MPKVKWGGDEALSATDIDDAEVGFAPYAGDIPPSGVYRFKLARVKKVEFGSGNHGLKVLITLDGSWKPDHRKFDGCPAWVNVVNTKSAASFVRAFCDSIGVTAKDFLTAIVVDEDDVVQTIGRVKIANQDLLVYGNVKRGRYEDGPWRLEGNGTTFLPQRDDDVEDANEAIEEAEERPSKASKGKGKKAKAGKTTTAAQDEEPPF